MNRAVPDVEGGTVARAAGGASPAGRLELLGWLLAMAGGLAVDLAVFGPQDVAQWLPDVAVGWAYLGGGLLLRARLPGGRIAFLLGLTGITWFLGTLVPALVFAHRGVLVHLLFAYPTGRLSGVGRVVVPVAYVVALFPGAWGNEWVTVGLAVGLSLVVEVHRREVAGPLRRARQQAAAVAGLVGLLLVGSALARLVFARGDADRLASLVYAAALVAVAVAATRGVLRTTWRRAPVTDLVVQLGGNRSAAVRDALAQALGDPSLEVGYRDGEGFVDAGGRPVTRPAAGDPRASTVVRHDGQPVAVLVHDPAVLTDAVLLDAVAVAARLAARNDRLRADVQARVADLEESRRRLVAAADSERGLLAQRLAVGAARRLSAVRGSLERAGAGVSAATAVQIARATAELDHTDRDLQELAAGLDPVPDGDLAGALTGLSARAPVPVELTVAVGRLPPEVAAAMWYVAAEAVTNAVKHAHATGIAVELTVERGTAALTVSDDGWGGADPTGSGLKGLADRVDALDGELRITSLPGGGTTVRVTLPAVPVS